MTTVAIRPEARPTRDYQFPEFHHRKLDNGVQLLVAPMHKVPLVTVLAIADAGATTGPLNKAGIAALTARALTEGAGDLDGEALTDYLERLGTSISASADWDNATVSMTVLAHKLKDAFAKFTDVLTRPLFPEHAIERLKGERLTEIIHTESEPREHASDMFERFVYSEHSRYGQPVGGVRETVESLTRQDVVDFFNDRYRPQSTTIIVTGDITVEAAEEMVRAGLNDWSGAPVSDVTLDDTAAHQSRMVHLVPRADAPQSELRIGHVGVPRNHPDYFDITVMNAILGGLFGSRINLNLREAHGYTYGAFSRFDWRRASGPFLVSTAVASNVTALAIRETLLEIDRMRSELVSDSEMSLAVDYLDGVFPIRFETTASVAGALAALVIYNLPADWYDTYRENIRKVTPERVLTAAQRYVHPDKLQIVILGNASEVQPLLEEADFGTLVVHQDIKAV